MGLPECALDVCPAQFAPILLREMDVVTDIQVTISYRRDRRNNFGDKWPSLERLFDIVRMDSVLMNASYAYAGFDAITCFIGCNRCRDANKCESGGRMR
jgi:hypothetical protein